MSNPMIALIVDDDLRTVAQVTETLKDAGCDVIPVATDAEAWCKLRLDPSIGLVVLRFRTPAIDGCSLCRRIREVRSREQLSVLIVVPEDQLELAGEALSAGANDILIAPFEARELRLKANLSPATHGRRIDRAHTADSTLEAVAQSDAAVTQDRLVTHLPNMRIDTAERSCDSQEPAGYQQGSTLIAPVFDPVTLRFIHPIGAEQARAWDLDEKVTKIALDEVMVCPDCGSLPTFRMGCSQCGSAGSEHESLIHHYACAHIGPESDFRRGQELICPKCRLTQMVIGADFEVVSGGCRCVDCGAVSSEQELIGHCLSCQYRFPARDAAVESLTGYSVPMHKAGESQSALGGHSRILRKSGRKSAQVH